MKVYRGLWHTVVGILSAVGALLALAVWSFPGTLGLFVGAFVLALAILATIGGASGPRVKSIQRLATHAAVLAVHTIGLVGLLAALGSATLGLLILVGGSSPFVVAHLIGRIRGRRGLADSRRHRASELPRPRAACSTSPKTRASPNGSKLSEPSTHELDDEQLCLAWRRSFLLLERATGKDRVRIVELRREYLDELESRHPANFRSWLASGARAASDPSRFLGSSTSQLFHTDGGPGW